MSALPTAKVATVLIAGWLAQTLASTDPDIDAGVAAYEAEDFESALERFDAAKERLGERPEVGFDRGLALLRLDKLDEARRAFERATESADPTLRASALYELGNLDFDAESYAPAVERFTDALKANPLHANAKWNLELALLKKKEQEEQEEKDEEEKDEEEKDEGDEDEGDEEEKDDEEQEDEEQEDEEQQDEEQQDEEQQDEGDEEEQDEGEQDEGEKDEGEQDEQEPPDDGEPEEQESEPEDDAKDQPDPKQDEPPPEEGEPNAEPKPVDRMDMKRALEKLDEQDPFTLDKPGSGYVQPEKDW
ncbi:MAG: tetratricopeptide repeat protein [Nannocystales bacterium]